MRHTGNAVQCVFDVNIGRRVKYSKQVGKECPSKVFFNDRFLRATRDIDNNDVCENGTLNLVRF